MISITATKDTDNSSSTSNTDAAGSNIITENGTSTDTNSAADTVIKTEPVDPNVKLEQGAASIPKPALQEQIPDMSTYICSYMYNSTL